jgi:drug/metabolite transporter (DMT)-like permease
MMKIVLPLLFALTAAVGNAIFALAQRRAAGAHNGIAMTASSVIVAVALLCCVAPMTGQLHLAELVATQGKNLLLGGFGLFLVYIGFYLMYSRFGVSPYILYAVLSILTTSVIVGILWLKEPINGLRIASIVLALVSVILYSLSETQRG